MPKRKLNTPNIIIALLLAIIGIAILVWITFSPQFGMYRIIALTTLLFLLMVLALSVTKMLQFIQANKQTLSTIATDEQALTPSSLLAED